MLPFLLTATEKAGFDPVSRNGSRLETVTLSSFGAIFKKRDMWVP